MSSKKVRQRGLTAVYGSCHRSRCSRRRPTASRVRTAPPSTPATPTRGCSTAGGGPGSTARSAPCARTAPGRLMTARSATPARPGAPRPQPALTFCRVPSQLQLATHFNTKGRLTVQCCGCPRYAGANGTCDRCPLGRRPEDVPAESEVGATVCVECAGTEVRHPRSFRMSPVMRQLRRHQDGDGGW